MKSNPTYPPKFFIKFFRWFCHPKLVNHIEGDLLEEYSNRVVEKGKWKADLNFCWDVLLLFRPSIVRPMEGYKHVNAYGMFKNYFKISTRNIINHKMISFINVFSLAVGLAACLVIYLFVSDEKSFDAFHTNHANIYRLDEVQSFPGTNEQKVALSMPGMGPALLKDFPEVTNYTRFMNREKILVIKDDKRVILPHVAQVDSTFLDIFDFVLIQGDRNTALDMPYTMVVTEETALRFFSTLDEALNNSLTYRNKEYKITGIIKNVPENSHMQFDILASLTTVTTEQKDFNDQWGGNYLNTYLVLTPNVDIQALEAKFPGFMSRHMDDPKINDYYKLFLQTLLDVHLTSTDMEHDYNNYRKFNGSYLNIFYVIGGFILLIAAVNFMNLTTARASHRWKEIGVRKTVGAKKLELFGQFIFESVLLAIIALVIAIGIDLLFIPILNNLIGRQLSIIPFLQSGWQVLLVVVATLILGILTGIYPSFYMTSFNMSRVLKGGGKGEGRSMFRSTLVVVQFGLAIVMIVSTLIVVQQLSFMKNTDIGFNKDQILLVAMNREANQQFETIKKELSQQSVVKGVTASGQRLGNNFHQWGSFKVKSDTGVVSTNPSNVNVDYDYLKVYGMDLVQGRGFDKNVLTDNGKAFVINETLAKELGLKDAAGLPAGFDWMHNDSLGSIIGVVRDFNFNSLHYKINTLQMVVSPDWGYDEMSVKLESGRTEEGIAIVKNIWDKLIPNYPFDYSFLDAHFEELYRSDKQMSAVVSIMAGLAILISCLGLFGLAAITIEKKTKEIGVRKVLGATEGQITLLLSRNFAMLIALAFLIVSPLTYFALNWWLEGFAYRISINPLIFVLGGVLALAIGLITISYHTLRSARANPVKALRYE